MRTTVHKENNYFYLNKFAIADTYMYMINAHFFLSQLAKINSQDRESSVIPVTIGGIFSACVILVIVITAFLIR